MARKHAPKAFSLEEGVVRLRAKYGGRLLPVLDGLAYRFTIWLPIQARGEVVFTPAQRFVLGGLLNQCFGGYSHSRVEGFPAWSGSWLP